MVFWPGVQLAKAEERLFASGAAWWRRFKAAHAPGTAAAKEAPATQIEFLDVVDGQGRAIHTVTFSGKKQEGTPLVLTHGYASGSGIYYAAAAPIAEQWPGPVYIIDNPGCGLSDRPAWAKVSAESCAVEEAEDFYVDRLDGWRAAMGIDRMVLCGHSLGGYMAVAYAERHAARVERLVLVSPVGVPKATPMSKEKLDALPVAFKVLRRLWAGGWSPFTVVRWGPGHWLVRPLGLDPPTSESSHPLAALLGHARSLTLASSDASSLSPPQMSGYVNRRMGEGSWRDAEALTDYFYANLTHGEESWGGCAHATLLEPGAYARAPLCERIPKLDFSCGLRLSFIYGGSHDWMSARSATELQRSMASGPAGRRGRVPIQVATVAYAGHNLMVDNPVGFTEALMASGRVAAAGADDGFDGRSFGEEVWLYDRAQQQRLSQSDEAGELVAGAATK